MKLNINIFTELRTFFIILISTLLTFQVKSQSLDETYEFAVLKYQSQDYEIAIASFNRIYFFSSDQNLKKKVSVMLAECYYAIEEYHKANKFIDIAYTLEITDQSKNDLVFKKVLNHYLLNEYQYALIELFSLDDNLNVEQERSKQFYFGLIYFLQSNYEKAATHFQEGIKDNEVKKYRIDSLLKVNDKIREKWPVTSQYMSIFIPGSGQLANGAYQSAFNSFLLTSSLIILYGYTTLNYSLVDGALSVLPWFMRYHRGGYENAYRIALQKQQNKRNRILQEIIEVYEDIVISEE